MISIRPYIMLIICSIISCVTQSGCSANLNAKVPETINAGKEIFVMSSDFNCIDSNFPLENDCNTMDYSQYLNKIWVVSDWDGGAYTSYPLSFFITGIENGEIKGKFAIEMVAEPDFFTIRMESSKYLGDFSGALNNGKAECQFNNVVGNKGTFILEFKDTDRIEATINFTEKKDNYANLYATGVFSFRPYNLSDIKSFTKNENCSFTVDLNSWGVVNFVSGEIGDMNSRVRFPNAYLTDEKENILYLFSVSQVDTEIVNASIEDINGDGLKDIMITSRFIVATDVEDINWTFYQMENGLFYNSLLTTE